MNWADFAIVAIIAISAAISLIRGFIREVLSLVAWFLAFWVAISFADAGAGMLAEHVATPSIRLLLAFLVLFLLTLAACGIVNFLIGKLVDTTGLSGTDRTLGLLFGVFRGIVVVGILVLAAGLTAVPRDPWWEASVLLGHFERLGMWVIGFFPESLAEHFSY